jgi:C1A family cysteine protease
MLLSGKRRMIRLPRLERGGVLRPTAIGAVLLYLLAVGCIYAGAFAGLSPEAEQAKIDRISRENEENGYSWTAGHTSVSGLTDEEFEHLLGLRLPADLEERRQRAARDGRLITAPEGMSLPPSFDWRAQGGVTAVKNQGNCGSCWAFCAAAAFESQILIKSGLEEDLSEQAVVSCNPNGDDCGGGWMETAYDLFVSQGAVRETCMPYHEVDTDPCVTASCDVAAHLDSYYYVDDTVEAIKTAMLTGPVACAIAVCGGFDSYTGGCYEEDCSEINHGVLLVGWDDSMCGGDGAWIIKNSWGPDWGDNGFMYIKYGSCYIGYATDGLNYTPGQTVHFFYDSHLVDDSGGDGDGNIESGEPITLALSILNIGAETATNVTATLRSLTAGVSVEDSVATYSNIDKGAALQSDSPHFSFEVSPSAQACGALRFQVEVDSDQGSSTRALVLQGGEIITVFQDGFESDLGWTAGLPGDGAVTGMWERGDPNATYWGPEEVQPENDCTPGAGTRCYFTQQSDPGASQGAYDVDGGRTTLISPALDLSDLDSALLTYQRWYSSNTGSGPNDDDFVVDVSNDGGVTWHNLETLPYAERCWRKMEFYLEDYLTLTDLMKFRFVAQDSSPGSIVEAALDDVVITGCESAVIDVESPVVTVDSPNGGEVLHFGTVHDIEWTATDNIGVTSVCILLSTDGGATFPDTVAAGEANDGAFAWPIPDVDSQAARIKVVACDGAMNEGHDESDSDFRLWGYQSGVDGPDVTGVPDRAYINVKSGAIACAAATIEFGLPSASNARIDCYDVAGRRVAAVMSGRVAEGYHSIDWDLTTEAGGRLGPGIYFLRLDSDGGSVTTKVAVAW